MAAPERAGRLHKHKLAEWRAVGKVAGDVLTAKARTGGGRCASAT